MSELVLVIAALRDNNLLTCRAVNGALTVTLQQAQQLGSILGKDSPSNWTKIQQDITILKAPSGILLEFGAQTALPV